MTSFSRRSLVGLALGSPLLASLARADSSFLSTLRSWSADPSGAVHLLDAALLTPTSRSGSLALSAAETELLLELLGDARPDLMGFDAAGERFVVTRRAPGELHGIALEGGRYLVGVRQGDVALIATSAPRAVHPRAHEAVLRYFSDARVA